MKYVTPILLLSFLLISVISYSQIKKSKTIQGNQYNAGRDINITKKTTINVQKEKLISVAENFDVKTYKWMDEKILLNVAKYAYELKPKQGIWSMPFVAIPIEEESKVQFDFGVDPAISLYRSNTLLTKEKITLNNKDYNVRLNYYMNTQSTSSKGLVFSCHEKPSILIFGDWSDPEKRYSVKL
jgi:hypothetical protein